MRVVIKLCTGASEALQKFT